MAINTGRPQPEEFELTVTHGPCKFVSCSPGLAELNSEVMRCCRIISR